MKAEREREGPRFEGCEGWLAWDFTGRHPGIAVGVEREAAVAGLIPHYREAVEGLGASFSDLRSAEQVHGAGIAVVGEGELLRESVLPHTHAGVDGLMTDQAGPVLGILVADCCAVYVVDPVRRAIALLHSGKKGSEMGIVPQAIGRMGERFGTRPEDLRVGLSPCIRPPHYEIDFAAEIRRQCVEAGVPARSIDDQGLCTGSDTARFYSYRVEKGKTGRMLALLGIRNREKPGQ